MKLPKHISILLLLTFTTVELSSQDYTWIHGSTQIMQPPIVGTPMVPAPANIPGARQHMMYWKDANGKFWVYGGIGIDAYGMTSYLNDLWKYDPLTNQWALMKGDSIGNRSGKYGTMGVASSTTMPGGRWAGVSWTDVNGMLWMFGGEGYDANGQLGYLGDLWKYNPGTNAWTWVKGGNTANPSSSYGTMGVAASSNMPPGRMYAASWLDNAGDFWLFGGSNSQWGTHCDLWKYSVSTNQWTWMQGSSLAGQYGKYGQQGVASATNNPGSRDGAITWTDNNGDLWLHGGSGYCKMGFQLGQMNDLWRYSMSSNQWTWISGDNQQTFVLGVYGTMGVPAASNIPGSRLGAVSWTDANNNLWMFGGHGMGNTGGGDMNDIWKYSVSTGLWTWVRGSTTYANIAVFGTLGVSSPQNTSGGRLNAAGWVDAAGILYLFGGRAYATNSLVSDFSNDMWRLGNCTTPSLAVQPGSVSVCVGNQVTLTATGANTYSWSNGQTGSSITVTPSSNTTYTLISKDLANCGVNVIAGITVNPLPQLTVTPQQNSVCYNSPITFSANGAVTYSWSSGQTGSPTTLTATNTSYTVTGYSSAGCSASKTVSITLLALPQLSLSSTSGSICAGEPYNIAISGATQYTWMPGGSSSNTVTVSPLFSTNYIVTGENVEGCRNTASVFITVDECSALKDAEQESMIIYPNPFQDKITIQNSGKTGNVKAEIYDALGRVILNVAVEDYTVISTSNFEQGLYFLRLYKEGDLYKELRIMKQ